jgi:hypothetical protein
MSSNFGKKTKMRSLKNYKKELLFVVQLVLLGFLSLTIASLLH